MKPPYLIAEVGVNYYDTAKEEGITPLEAAKFYIDKVAESGADAVKFQTYKAETLASKDSPAYWDQSKESANCQYDLFKKFDSFNEAEYRELASYAKEKNIDFMSTPFDFASADYLDDLMDIYKISSSDITNFPFLEHIAKKGKPVYLSTGASNLSEIDEALRVLENAGCEDVCLLHCVLSYPTKLNDANLSMITGLKKAFPHVKIGYSDHTMPDEAMCVLTTAFLKGAEVIEKHFTLDKNLEGNDHYHAGDPEDFRKAVDAFQRICDISGSEERRSVLPCESESRLQARRSIVLTKDVEVGHKIERDDLTFKRPGTGISRKDIEKVVGREMKQAAKEDDRLTWFMLG